MALVAICGEGAHGGSSLISALALCLLFHACGGAGGSVPPSSSSAALLDEAALGVGTLQTWYNPSTGLWQTTGWWNAANAVTVLVDYSHQSHSSRYLAAVSNTFTLNAANGFLNNYYDDEGWWALAWIAAYDQTRDAKYLNEAEGIFSDMTAGWDNTCGGGIWWNKDRRYKNAIANELFLSVAAQLAWRTAGPQRSDDLAWAEKEWAWFSASGMINAQSLINDGLNSSCQNNQRTTWSYNQGVILGGLVALSKDARDRSLLEQAQAIALSAIKTLSDANGILDDPCEPNCGADGVQFKGIFVRNLAALGAAHPVPQYATFLAANAKSIWQNDQGPNVEFGQVWFGPFQGANAASQTSAIDCLLAAAESARK
jgi:predicted alpha-1,6-mannanase (GH76 family)